MNANYDDVFKAALAYHHRQAEETGLQLAAKAASALAGLKAAQLSGLVNMAIHAADVVKIKEELEKRNQKRWQKGSSGPYPDPLGRDIETLKSEADRAIEQTIASLDTIFGEEGAGLPPQGDVHTWKADLHLQLTRQYLTAAVGFARTGA